MFRSPWHQVCLESTSLNCKFSTLIINPIRLPAKKRPRKPPCLPPRDFSTSLTWGVRGQVSLWAMPRGPWGGWFGFVTFPWVTSEATLYCRWKIQASGLLTFTTKIRKYLTRETVPTACSMWYALINVESTKLYCQSRLSNHTATANLSFMWWPYLRSLKPVDCHADVKVTLFEPKSIFGGAKQAQFSSCWGHTKSGN